MVVPVGHHCGLIYLIRPQNFETLATEPCRESAHSCEQAADRYVAQATTRLIAFVALNETELQITFELGIKSIPRHPHLLVNRSEHLPNLCF
jgi:hypothetical protein